MEATNAAADKFKAFAKSTEKLAKGVVRKITNNGRSRDPIEILKRLQRETFSELMKLREREDKIERMLSLYRSNKEGPFQGARTTIKGNIYAKGALLLTENVSDSTCNMLNMGGMRTGVNSRFSFETVIREKDSLITQFTATHANQGFQGNISGSPLTLKKVKYTATINDWLSAVVTPVGAQCRDVGLGNSLLQGHTKFSAWFPPLFNEIHGCAVGLIAKGSKVSASVTEFVSWLGQQPNSVSVRRCLSTFGQFMYQPWDGTRLTLVGLHRMPTSRTQNIRLDSLTIPLSSLRFTGPSTSAARNVTNDFSSGSIALMLESAIDEISRVGGWVELQKSNPRNLQWAVCLSETPEDEIGWGVSAGGVIKQPSTLVHTQMEAFLRFNFGKRFSLEPGIVYSINERLPILMLNSTWSM